MVFLTPLFLIGLLAALIPVAIHLIRREKPPKVMFSTIRFLKKTSKKLVLFQHLQQIALLLLRAAVIVLLVLAFARPLFNQSVARLLDADPQSAVILLDLSMSMRWQDNFDQAKAEALAVVDRLSGSDELGLIAFSGAAEVVRELGTEGGQVRELIESFGEPGFGGTRYYPNLRLADQMLEDSRYENRAIYLISDFQEVGLQGADESWKLAPGVALYLIDVGSADSENLVLTDVRSPEQLLEDSAQQQILARVRSTGTQYLGSGEVSLSLNGQMVDRRLVDLTDRSEQVVTFAVDFEAEGYHVGEIRVAGDDFSDDNAYYFTVDVLPKINVLLVNGEASDNWFDDEGHWFGLAVSSTDSSPFSLETIDPAELSAAAMRQSDVVALLNVGELTSSQAAALSEYVVNGGSLLIAPGDRVDGRAFNQQLGEISPARLEQVGLLSRDDYLVIADYDRRHPILRPLGSDWSARFQGHWRLTPSEDAKVLMQFDNTEAALVEKDVGEGKILLFASSLDLEWNNLALQGLFLPFVHETLRHLVRSEAGQSAYEIGDSINLAQFVSDAEVAVRDANGRSVSLEANNLQRATSPGLFTATSGAVSSRYAVNILPEESNFMRVATSTLYDAVVNPDTSPLQSREAQTAQLIEELENPQRLWWWILMLVMALLLLEVLVANRTYR
ncbi:MAG: BatA domain-containing protein [Pseudomonadota bacterium]|nr:BatA domain-containing protein [Pseudomonadota bacterium]